MSKNRFTSAVIAAAGNSERMGGDTPKLLLDLCGKPVIAHTLLAYQNAECINEIIVVTKPGLIDKITQIAKANGITKLKSVISGGETRADSVRLGLDAIDKHSAFIAVADGARCLTTPEMIAEVCLSAYLNGCATAATKAVDTVKIGDRSAFIESTPERNRVWCAQTPQVFSVPIFRAASYSAYEKKQASTDDNQLVELIGYPVKLVDCGNQNIKLTTPLDLAIAEIILKTQYAEREARLAAEDGGYLKK